MAKVRVSSLAEEMGFTVEGVVEELNRMGVHVDSGSSTVDSRVAAPLGRRIMARERERLRAAREGVERGTNREAAASRERWREFGSLVAALRLRRGLTQAQLGEAVGAGGSWVSQVEAGSLVPGPDRTVRLGVVLGPEISELAAQLRGESTPGDSSDDALIMALLWRGRADLLGRMSAASQSRYARMRFDRLSRDLLAAASAHPTVASYLDRAQLRPLSSLAERASSRVKQLVAVELATMKIDAPYEAETDLKSRLDLMEFVLEDLGLSSAHPAMHEAVINAPRSRPAWSELPSCGGPLGNASMVRGALDPEQVLLIGDDPAGWLGAEFVGGQWLLPPAGNSSTVGTRGLFGADARATGTSVGVATASGIAVAGAAAAGLGMLLPVATPLLIAGAADVARRRFRAKHRPPTEPAEDDSKESSSGAGELAVAFGWAWTRVETAKLLTLYSCFGEPAKGLPGPTHVAEYLQAEADVVQNEARRERELSGTSDLGRNAPLHNLVDVADSLKVTAARLKKIAQ